MNDFNSLAVRSGPPRSVEIDPSCHSVYIRFKTAKIQKTISRDDGPTVVTVDLDSNNGVIGIELIGVREFSIAAIRHFLPTRLRDVNFERTRFMPVTQAPSRHPEMEAA